MKIIPKFQFGSPAPKKDRFGDTFLKDWSQFYGGPVTSLYLLDANGSPLKRNGKNIKNTYGKVNKSSNYNFDINTRIDAVLNSLNSGSATIDDINMMQRRHAGLYAGYDENYSPVASDLVKKYQDDYKSLGYNESVIAPSYQTNYSIASNKPISGDSSSKGWISDGRYDLITDDRRVLARKEDYLNPDGTTDNARLWLDMVKFRNAGYDYYLDPESNYYMLRKYEPKKSELSPCILSYMKQGMDEAHARALCEGAEAKEVNPEDLNTEVDDPTEPLSLIKANESKEKTPNIKKNKFDFSSLIPGLFGAARVIVDNAATRKANEEYISNIHTPWQTPWEAYRMVHGDYIAKQEGERQAARLRNTASRPFTADADRQMAYQLEAVDKGNLYILAGQQKDANEFYRTSEVAAQQGIQNILNRTNTANMNSLLNSLYEEMKARIRRDYKIHNMQNWDRWASVWEDRALAQYDYDKNRKRLLQENFEDSLINYGIDTHKYNAAYEEYAKTRSIEDLTEKEIEEYKEIINDSTKSEEVKKLALKKLDAYNRKVNAERAIRDEAKALQIAKIRNQGNYLGVNWNNLPDDTRKVLGVKNGGILRKMQQGGGFPYVEWTPLMGRPYQTYLSLLMSGDAGSSSRASSSSQSSTAEKEEATLLKNIVETLKGGDLLPSDVGVISQLLKQFFDIQRYAPEGALGVDSLYRGYIDALSYVNRAKYGANTIKEAKTHLDENKALNSYAVDLEGKVWIGKVGTQEIMRVNPNDAVQIMQEGEKSGYRILTNSDLLTVRSLLPTYAFNDNLITTAATSATSMEAIAKYVKDFIGTLGSDKQSRDIFARDFGQSAEQGLAVLNNIKNQGFSEKETEYIGSVISGAGSINSLLELNVATESQLNLAKMALRALSLSLPLNMLALLYLQGGGLLGADEILTNLVLKGTSSQFGFKINDITPFNPDGTLGSSSKTGKGSSSSGEDKYKLSTTAQWISGVGELTTFNINPESKGTVAWQVTGNTMPITDMSDKSMEGAFTLQDISGNSTLDLQHAYIGNTKITSLGLGKVLITDPNITRVALPVTVDELGGVKPYFERISLVNQINAELKNKNIPTDYVFDHVPTEQEKESIIKPINKAYQNKGLPPKYDENTGKLNFGNYKYFGLIKGFSPKSALDPSNEFDNDLLKELSGDLRDDFEARIKKIDSNFKFDNGWFSNEPVYEGIIFIPLRDNIFNSLAGKGSTYAPENPNAMNTIDAMQQKSDALKARGEVRPLRNTNFNQ